MKRLGLVIGLAAAASAVLLLAVSSSKAKPAPEFSPALRPPMQRGNGYLVTYSVPNGTSQQQARALLNFARSWADEISPATFSPDAQGRPTVTISAVAVQDLPSGPPSIPGPSGDLIPLVWTVTEQLA